MRKRILKVQLVFLCILTFANILSLFQLENFNDNILKISSVHSETNIFSYTISSLFILANYLIGPWIVLPTVFFIAFYFLFFPKRNNFFDIFHFICVLIIFLGLNYFIWEESLGEGLKEVLEGNFTSWEIMVSCLAVSALYFQLFSKFKIPGFRFINFSRKQKNIKKLIELQIEDSGQLGDRTQQDFQQSNIKKDATDNEDIKLLEGNNSEYKLNEELIEIKVKEETVTNIVHSKLDQEDPIEETSYFEKCGNLINIISAKNSFKKRELSRDENYFSKIIDCLEEKFNEFKINGHIVNVLKGPVVDTFELELGAGVKVSRVTSIAEDLSLALKGVLLRMVYPMKGKSTIGIEIPRDSRDMIYLGEVFSSENFINSKYHLPLAIGKDAFGEVFVADLSSMPHVLVAGSTGAGKSVFINNLLISLLVKKSPAQMKLLLIDPKQLELSLYSKLPHLILPVMTSSDDASYSLAWVCNEMERRYSILKEAGVRNIETFNERVGRLNADELKKINEWNKLYYNESSNIELPYLVVVVDEFADLVLSKKGKEIEESICRIAAKARAAGIHLIVATQRPSVDVITGLIKSNFPTRISFRVTSSIDSRTILNSLGAEKLLGKGDMLYKYGIEMIRLHSAYIGEEDIEELIGNFKFKEPLYDRSAHNFLEMKKRSNRETKEDHFRFGENEFWQDAQSGEVSTDELYQEAIKIVKEQKSVSASLLQRKLKIGYNRAANLVETMESEGVVGPQLGSKPRKVLILPEDQP